MGVLAIASNIIIKACSKAEQCSSKNVLFFTQNQTSERYRNQPIMHLFPVNSFDR